MSCEICISKYNKTVNSRVECQCEYVACKQCVRQYLLTTSQEAHCMHCRKKWNTEFVKENLGASFVNKELKEHHSKILVERSIAKREELLPEAIRYRDDRADKKRMSELRKKIMELRNQINEYENEIEDINNNIRVRHGQRRHYRNWHRQLREEQAAEQEEQAAEPVQKKRRFIMPCQYEGCNGMLTEKYHCELCSKTTCSKCLEIKEENHECNEETVETAKLLRKESKGCPKCGIRISKIDGCDQMWCVECKTAFSWNTGEIVTRHIHNPHYYQYMRERNQLPATVDNGAQIGCRERDYREEATNKLWLLWSRTKSKTARNLENFVRYVNHLVGITIASLNGLIQNKTEKTRINEYEYILGEISKDELKKILITNQKCVQKDQVFHDIYRGIQLIAEEICMEIVQTANPDYKRIWKTVVKYMAYFHMEMIKALMLYDSKRDIVMFDPEIEQIPGRLRHSHIEKKYENKAEMMRDLEKLEAIYRGEIVDLTGDA